MGSVVGTRPDLRSFCSGRVLPLYVLAASGLYVGHQPIRRGEARAPPRVWRRVRPVPSAIAVRKARAEWPDEHLLPDVNLESLSGCPHAFGHQPWRALIP